MWKYHLRGLFISCIFKWIYILQGSPCNKPSLFKPKRRAKIYWHVCKIYLFPRTPGQTVAAREGQGSFKYSIVRWIVYRVYRVYREQI